MAGVVSGSALGAAAATGCPAQDEGAPLNARTITRKLAMHNRPIVKMLFPPITLAGPLPRRCNSAEMLYDGREIALLRCHSATLLQQDPHGVVDLLLGVVRRQKETQSRSTFGYLSV